MATLLLFIACEDNTYKQVDVATDVALTDKEIEYIQDANFSYSGQS